MTDRETMAQRPKEPLFNAPPLAILLPVILITLYALQSLAPAQVQDSLLESFALRPNLLRQGDYDLLLTHLFLHGSWLHVLFNSAFCLAFATPVIRAFGRGLGGTLSYIVFYLLCGAVAGAGYCLLNWTSVTPVVGASGAISGLVGAAIRVRSDDYDGDLKPLLHPRVLTMTLFWCGGNVLTAFVPAVSGVGDVVVAWEAHVVGYLFGLLLISPWLRLFHRRYFTTN